jgi:glycosyltransferase involved in cell wall biosynthesis
VTGRVIDPPELLWMKISIITACLNRKEFIGAAIESVLAQNYPEFEHWIIDGGSSDGTLEVLKRYPHLNVLSEPDRGVYDAWNKGIDRASGDVVSILNSDDVYAAGALQSCARAFAASPSASVVSGGCQIFRISRRGTVVEMHRYQDPRRYRLSLRNATVGLPIINSRFFRRSVFDKVGRFDLEYTVASDREFLIRAALSGIQDVSTPEIFYRYCWHAGSLTMNAGNRSMLRALDDGLQMIRKIRASRSLEPGDDKTLREWRRDLQAGIVLVHTVLRDRRTAMSLAKESFLADPRWLFAFLRCGAFAVGRRVRMHFRIWAQDRMARTIEGLGFGQKKAKTI